MSALEQTYEQILAYLKGLLSNRQRHDLEKRMMQDAFDEEAFEGLSQMTAEELETDMDSLADRLQERTRPVKKRYLMPLLRIAAGMAILAGAAGLLYFILRSPSQELITQDIRVKEKPVPESAAPPAPEQTEEKVTESGSSEKTKDIENNREIEPVVLAENRQELLERTDAETEKKVEGIRTGEAPESPVVQRQKAAETVSQAIPSEKSDIRYITGKVVGVDGEALPGVTVMEKGTSQVVITDPDGNFSIQAGDKGSELLLSYAGYEPLELNTRDIAGKPVTMREDILALDEVVVVGYGTRKKKDETGAVSYLEADDHSNYVGPVPPGGSLKAFKNWINERIDSAQFKLFPGKHRIQVNLTVQQDGHIHDIRIRSEAPVPIVDEYKKALDQSPLWKPALKGEEPVEAEVVIRFIFTVD